MAKAESNVSLRFYYIWINHYIRCVTSAFFQLFTRPKTAAILSLIYVSSSKLGNYFTATPSAPYIVSTSEGYDTAYSEEKTYSLSKETATNVFVPVLPGTYENKAWLNYYNPGSSGQTGIGFNITIERGKITRFNDVLIINPS